MKPEQYSLDGGLAASPSRGVIDRRSLKMSWELLGVLIFAASFAQAATGIGFGVIAGPFLIHAHGYDHAVVETAIFSLAVAAVCSARSLGSVERRFAGVLTGVLPIGLGIGAALTWFVTKSVIVAIFGILLCVLSVSLLRQEMSLHHSATAGDISRKGRLPHFAFVALVAAIAAFLFAAPGPIAAWGLARADLAPRAIRETLAVYFLVAYGALVVAFVALGRFTLIEWPPLASMTVACVAGAVTGAFYGDRLSARILRIAIGAIIGLSGLSVLVVLLRPTTG